MKIDHLERLVEVMSNVEIEKETIQLDEYVTQENHYFKLEENDYLWLIEQAEKAGKSSERSRNNELGNGRDR